MVQFFMPHSVYKLQVCLPELIDILSSMSFADDYEEVHICNGLNNPLCQVVTYHMT